MQSHPPLVYAPVILKLLQGAIYSDDQHWHQLQDYLTPIKKYFGEIGLQVHNYDTEGFAYLEQPDPDSDDPAEPLPRLMRRSPLSFNATVLCVLLREELRQFDASDATGRLVLNIKKLRDLLQPYLLKVEKNDNNEGTFRKKVEELVNRVVELGFLKSLSKQDENYEVRPILKAKIDADMLESLKQKLEAYATSHTL